MYVDCDCDPSTFDGQGGNITKFPIFNRLFVNNTIMMTCIDIQCSLAYQDFNKGSNTYGKKLVYIALFLLRIFLWLEDQYNSKLTQELR